MGLLGRWIGNFQVAKPSMKRSAADSQSPGRFGPIAVTLFQSAENKGLFALVQI